jgi:protein TonB
MGRWTILGVLLSLAVHLGVGIGIAAIPKDMVRKHSLVAIVDKKKKAKKDEDKPVKDEPPPPPKPKEPPRALPKPKPAPENTPPPPANTPPPSAAAHAQLAALPNLGISMAGGPGGVGIAVPTGPTGPDLGTAAAREVEAPKTALKPKDDCTEDAVKPKLGAGGIPQEGIKAAAQAAGGIEGKIRLELLVDENGVVTSARVISGLGGGVDDAAISAGRRAKLTPSTKCGRPVAGRLVVSVRVDSE